MGKAGQTGLALWKCTAMPTHFASVNSVCPAFFKENYTSRTFLDHSNCENALAEGSGRPLGDRVGFVIFDGCWDDSSLG